MSNQHPKGYNNPNYWDSVENKNNPITIIDTDKTEFVEAEPVEPKDESWYKPDFDESPKEDFGEVLQLTEFNGLPTQNDFVVAEYNKIDTISIDNNTKKIAKKFVQKITKFVLEFNDIQLSDDHKDYIRQVGELQLSNLNDLLTLVEVNKQMITNIVARVNATQAEDYAIINSYNNLLNQHIKLIKEVATMYKAIPSVMKKMRADVLTNQELENQTENKELITEEYGETQFNNSKQMLRTILAKKENQNNN